MKHKFLKSAFSLLAATLVVACGGGGGSPGETNEPYSITLRAEKTTLPVNVAGYPVGIGVYAPYTTVLYIDAKKGSAPIPGGEDVFGCNTAYGLGSGPLYYLDGDDDHMEEVDDGRGGKVMVNKAYRAVVLDSNSGGASFHFHAGDQAGVATITCSVTDPASNRVVSASVNITVGAATGQAASIKTVSQYDHLGTQGNPNNVRTASVIQAFVLDDANQPVSGGSGANMQVAISAGGASTGARLLSGSQSGSVVRVNTVGGVGTFTLSSGTAEGTILLEIKADRADNDVSNGIQDPIVQLMPIAVTSGAAPGQAPDPLEITTDAALPEATNGIPYSFALGVKGGTAPYTWTALGGLPEGLTLSSAGLISGTPATKLEGNYSIAVRVVDSAGGALSTNISLAVAVTPGKDPATNQLVITSSSCGSDLCEFVAGNPPAAAPADDLYYQQVLTVTGPGTGSAVWTTAGAKPTWVSLSANGNLAISWAAANGLGVADCTTGSFQITATRGGANTTRSVILRVGTGAGVCPL